MSGHFAQGTFLSAGGSAARTGMLHRPWARASQHLRRCDKSKHLTHAMGASASDSLNILTAGRRGPALLQDGLIEEIAQCHREMIPDRRMQVKGSGAFGIFTVTHYTTHHTKAKIFAEVSKSFAGARLPPAEDAASVPPLPNVSLLTVQMWQSRTNAAWTAPRRLQVRSKHGRRGLALKADSADVAAVRGAVDQAVSTFGGLDILVNNAGIARGFGPLQGITLQVIDATLAVNVRAVIVESQAAAAHTAGGRTSISGACSHFGFPRPASALFDEQVGAHRMEAGARARSRQPGHHGQHSASRLD